MADIFDQLERFFVRCGWRFEASTDRSTICLVFDGKAGPWNMFVRAFEDTQRVAVYGVVPFKIEVARRLAAAELVTRINFGLVLGNFELDFTDGEVRFRTSLELAGEALADSLLLQLVRTNLGVMDRYIPAFVALVATALPATDALAVVE